MINYNQPQPKHKYVSSYDLAAAKAAAGGSPIASVSEASGVTAAAADMERGLLEDPFGGWQLKATKTVLKDEWVKFVSELTTWRSFITLTFKDEKTPDVAKSLFRWWVKVNNQYVFGKHYSKKVGHSYFSYLVGMEYQARDVVHFHVLVDQPIKYEVTHNAWGDRCGFAWIDGDLKDREKVISYVCKYVMKGGEIDLYKKQKEFTPTPKPSWWD